MMPVIRTALLCLAGLVVGLPFGLALGHRSFDKGTEMLSDILALSEYETLASLQYKESDLPHAKQALLDLLKFMDEMETNNGLGIQKEMDLDRSTALMRLALLEERAGNTSEAREYILNARETLKKRDGNDISEDKLRELVMQFDGTPTYKLPGIYILSRGMTGSLSSLH